MRTEDTSEKSELGIEGLVPLGAAWKGEMEALLSSVHEEAWDGFIPIEFSMDVSEVTSLQRPLPLYVSFFVLLRQSFALGSVPYSL